MESSQLIRILKRNLPLRALHHLIETRLVRPASVCSRIWRLIAYVLRPIFGVILTRLFASWSWSRTTFWELNEPSHLTCLHWLSSLKRLCFFLSSCILSLVALLLRPSTLLLEFYLWGAIVTQSVLLLALFLEGYVFGVIGLFLCINLGNQGAASGISI